LTVAATSTYAIGDDGSIELQEAVYALHADTGRVFDWTVGAGGELAALGSANGLA
jgi:hypothetical protein